jgi:hypothetical protein
MISTCQRQSTKNRKPRRVAKKKPLPQSFRKIQREILYTRSETAFVTGHHLSTIIRAWLNGCLSGKVIGNRVSHWGWQILEWIDAGGKTGPYPGQKKKGGQADLAKAA